MRTPRTRLTFGIFLAVTLMLGACGATSGSAQVTALESTAVVVPLPTDVDQAPDVVEVHRLAAGEQAVDSDGTTVTLHRWVSWPVVRTDTVLFGRLQVEPDQEELVAAYVDVCAAGDQAPGQELFRGRFQTVDPSTDLSSNLHDPANLILDSLVDPGFAWPPAGQCAQGWQVLRWSGAGDPVFQYTAVDLEAEAFGEQTVYAWLNVPQFSSEESLRVSPETASQKTPPSDQRPVVASIGTVQEVASGPLARWRMTVNGWLEVPDMRGQRGPFGTDFAVAHEGHRLIAVEVEVCAGENLTVPGFGLQIDGWNLIGQFRGGSSWAPGVSEIDLPEAGGCSKGWIAFESPTGAMPTGVFLTDPNDSTAPWLKWSLGDEAQLRLPELVGFPTDADVRSAEAACPTPADGASLSGAIGQLGLSLESDVGQTWPVDEDIDVASAVAVDLTDSLTEIHLSAATLSAQDVPVPRSSDTFSLVLRLGRSDPGALPLGTYGPPDASAGTAQVLLVQGEVGGYLPLADVTVVIDAVLDTGICGRVMAVGEDSALDSVEGWFGVPRWSDPS